MQGFFWAWQKQSTLPRTPESFEEEFPAVYSIDGNRFESVEEGLLFEFNFQWEFESVDDGRDRITESAYVSSSWMALCVFSKLGVCVFYLLFEMVSGVYVFLSMLLSVASISVVAGCYIVLIMVSSPVDESIDRGSEVSMCMPVATYLLGYLPLLYLVVQFSGGIRGAGIFSVMVISGAYWWYHTEVSQWSFRWQRAMEQKAKRIPMVTGKYVTSLVFGSLAPVVFLFSYDAPLWVALMSTMPYTAVTLFSVPLLLTQFLLRNTVLYDQQLSEIERFTAKGSNTSTEWSVWLSVLITVGASFLYLYLAYNFFITSRTFFATFSDVPAAAYILICGLPFLYFGFGVVYQSFSFLRGVIELVTKSYRHDFSDLYDCDADTYLFDTSALVAGAFSFGAKDFIIVSKGYRELLDDDALAAILAHEEGHLDAGDAQLATAIAVVSPFLFVGKNALYALFNFHDREIAADNYAIRKMSEDALRKALQQMQIYKARRNASESDSISGVIPTMVSFGQEDNDTSLFTRYFGFFYGTFAVQEAHPSLSERISTLL
jgi:Zn-dependent protease with chaperone function